MMGPLVSWGRRGHITGRKVKQVSSRTMLVKYEDRICKEGGSGKEEEERGRFGDKHGKVSQGLV